MVLLPGYYYPFSLHIKLVETSLYTSFVIISVTNDSKTVIIKVYYKIETTLIQIATDQFITNSDKMLLQIATAYLVQTATSLLQIATTLLQIVTAITNCDKYYKLQQNNQELLKKNLKNVNALLYCL